MERLKALEDFDSATHVVTVGGAVHTTVAAGRPRGLIRWFSIGLACACIAGGIALLAAMAEYRTFGAASRSPVGLAVSPLAGESHQRGRR